MSHLKITQAGVVAAATTVIGQVVAFVPSFAPDQQILISAASAVISAAFLLANAVHKLADSNVSADDVKNGAVNAARTELARVDFNALARDALNAQSPAALEGEVKAEVQKLLQGLFQPTPAPAPVVPAPVAPGPQPDAGMVR